MSNNCPICEAGISGWRLRKQFKCSSCGGTLKSNVKSISIFCMIFTSVITVFLFTSFRISFAGYDSIFLAKLAVLPLALLVYWIVVNIGNVIVIEKDSSF